MHRAVNAAVACVRAHFCEIHKFVAVVVVEYLEGENPEPEINHFRDRTLRSSVSARAAATHHTKGTTRVS